MKCLKMIDQPISLMYPAILACLFDGNGNQAIISTLQFSVAVSGCYDRWILSTSDKTHYVNYDARL